MFRLVNDELIFRWAGQGWPIDPQYRFPVCGPWSSPANSWEEVDCAMLHQAWSMGPVQCRPVGPDAWTLTVSDGPPTATDRQVMDTLLASRRRCAYYPELYQAQTVQVETLRASACLHYCTLEGGPAEVPALSLDHCRTQTLPQCQLLLVSQPIISDSLLYRAETLIHWMPGRPRPDGVRWRIEAPVVFMNWVDAGRRSDTWEVDVQAEVMVLCGGHDTFGSYVDQFPLRWQVGMLVDYATRCRWVQQEGGWVQTEELPPDLDYELPGVDLTPPSARVLLELQSARGGLRPGYEVVAENNKWRISRRRMAKSARSAES